MTLTKFLDLGGSVKLRYHGATEESSGYDVELALPYVGSETAQSAKTLENDGFKIRESRRRRQKLEERFYQHVQDDHIQDLVVTVKAHLTVQALAPIANRLNKDSTILLLQNGMGTYQEVCDKLFPDPMTRPNFVLGINSHGVHRTATFNVTHAGRGIITLGMVPRLPFNSAEKGTSDTPEPLRYHRKYDVKYLDPDDEVYKVWPDSARYITQTFLRTPLLAACAVDPVELHQMQLEKLAVNCIINPFTCLLDCRNGDILDNNALGRAWRLLVAEISTVICAMPELQHIPTLRNRFSPKRLEMYAVGVAKNTAENYSSMLQDMRKGIETEIEYINGYIVRRGEEVGFQCVMNYLLMQLVKGKEKMITREINDYVPGRDVPFKSE